MKPKLLMLMLTAFVLATPTIAADRCYSATGRQIKCIDTPFVVQPPPEQRSSRPPEVAKDAAVPQVIIGPAPEGEPTVIAKKIILENFDPPDCPLIARAVRISDGSIKAICNNGESYRVFRFNSQNLALRCSVVIKLGIEC